MSASLNKPASAFHLFRCLFTIRSANNAYIENHVSFDIKFIGLDQKHVELARQASPFLRFSGLTDKLDIKDTYMVFAIYRHSSRIS